MTQRSKRARLKDLVQAEPVKEGERLYRTESFSRTNSTRLDNSSRRHSAANRNEDSLIAALDMKRDVALVAGIFRKIDAGKLDVMGLFSGISTTVAKKLVYIALCGESEKNQLDAQKHLLALAGHNPAQKLEVGRLDADTKKEALLSLIAGSATELAEADITVVDDRPADGT